MCWNSFLFCLKIEIGNLSDFCHRYWRLFRVGNTENVLFCSATAFSVKGTDLFLYLSHWELAQQPSCNWRLVVNGVYWDSWDLCGVFEYFPFEFNWPGVAFCVRPNRIGIWTVLVFGVRDDLYFWHLKILIMMCHFMINSWIWICNLFKIFIYTGSKYFEFSIMYLHWYFGAGIFGSTASRPLWHIQTWTEHEFGQLMQGHGPRSLAFEMSIVDTFWGSLHCNFLTSNPAAGARNH